MLLLPVSHGIVMHLENSDQSAIVFTFFDGIITCEGIHKF